MNAKEARALTEIYLHPDIDTLVVTIDQRIEEAARQGQNHITEPHLGHLYGDLSPEQIFSLRKHYESRGFIWRASPKSGHPCCRGLITITW